MDDKIIMKAITLFFIFIVTISCGKEAAKKSSTRLQDVSAYYSSSKLNISVYYEEGAEPYTDKVGSLELWNLLQSNLEALYQGRSTEILVPGSLDEMTQLAAQKKSSESRL